MRDVLDNILRAEPAKPSTIRRQVERRGRDHRPQVPPARNANAATRAPANWAATSSRYLGGEPIEAKRDSTAYMLGKALKRYRVPVAVGVTLVLMLAVFSVAMTIMYGQATRAEQKAKDALARAEANFRAGHDLAMVMITSINDELTYLRGATRARELLLKEAKDYLERLHTEAGDDPDLLLDLASAHERVGDLQGVIYMRRLGETGEAEKNHARAREIRDALLARFPDDARMHAAAARSLYRAGGAAQLRGKLPEARQLFAESIAAYDRALRSPPADPVILAKWQDSRAWTLRALADILRLDARAAAAAGDESKVAQLADSSDEHYLLADAAWRAILVSGENEDARRGLGVVADCRALLSMVRAQLASTLAKRAATAGDTPAATAGYTTAISHITLAREAHQSTLAEFHTLARANAVSGEIRRHELVTTRYVALTFSEEARLCAELKTSDPAASARESDARAAAIASHQEAVRIARRLGDEDTRSVEARRDLAGCLLTLATELSAVGRTADAASVFDEVVALRREIARADPMERHDLDLAVGLLRLAEFRLDHPGSQTPGPAELLEQSQALLGPLKDRSVAGVDAYLAEVAKLRARVR
jgi:tetratricopeptide (TPR) repeat protein